ncbi:hypothetical protein GCM10011415_32590 [Salipiger pallidus]|uniref:Uncharacterized protein n=1 Tax=Salipiger pallidus TaxID=1775170 RepID=A0A8J3EHI4_9RHOB|nr:hypothetical protein GCM10011415_32590 [Salipiger pallidus]
MKAVRRLIAAFSGHLGNVGSGLSRMLNLGKQGVLAGFVFRSRRCRLMLKRKWRTCSWGQADGDAVSEKVPSMGPSGGELAPKIEMQAQLAIAEEQLGALMLSVRLACEARRTL